MFSHYCAINSLWWFNFSRYFLHSGIAWIEFLNSNDSLGDILSHLKEGDLKGAKLLWLRYEVKNTFHAYSTMMYCMPEMYLQDILTLGITLWSAMFIVHCYVCCDRDRSQKSLMSANLTLCSVPFQRTCHPKTSVLGLRLFLSHL